MSFSLEDIFKKKEYEKYNVKLSSLTFKERVNPFSPIEEKDLPEILQTLQELQRTNATRHPEEPLGFGISKNQSMAIWICNIDSFVIIYAKDKEGKAIKNEEHIQSYLIKFVLHDSVLTLSPNLTELVSMNKLKTDRVVLATVFLKNEEKTQKVIKDITANVGKTCVVVTTGIDITYKEDCSEKRPEYLAQMTEEERAAKTYVNLYFDGFRGIILIPNEKLEKERKNQIEKINKMIQKNPTTL